jgi:hypothetical protein
MSAPRGAIETTLAQLRDEGASPIDAIKALCGRYGLTVTDAKIALERHPAWTSVARDAEKLREALSTAIADLPGVTTIVLSPKAREHIASRGGSLYVWFEDAGPAFSRQRSAFANPGPTSDFRRFAAGDVNVYFPHEVELPREIRIDVAPWPYRRVSVRGFGADSHDAVTGSGGS